MTSAGDDRDTVRPMEVVALLGLLGALVLDRAPVLARGHADCGTVSDPNSELSNPLDPSGNPIRCEQARLDRRTATKVVLIGSGVLLTVSLLGWILASARLRSEASGNAP
jgi:hypothetical protein